MSRRGGSRPTTRRRCGQSSTTPPDTPSPEEETQTGSEQLILMFFFRFVPTEGLIYYTLTRNINTTLRLHTKSLIDRYESKDTGGESHETRAEATTSAAALPNQPTKHPRRTSVTVVSEAHREHPTNRHGCTTATQAPRHPHPHIDMFTSSCGSSAGRCSQRYLH